MLEFPNLLTKSLTYEDETKTINENKKSEKAQQKHKFKQAKWTFPNGHPRCLICGDEERTGGVCEGRKLSKSHELRNSKMDIIEFNITPEEALRASTKV